MTRLVLAKIHIIPINVKKRAIIILMDAISLTSQGLPILIDTYIQYLYFLQITVNLILINYESFFMIS